MAISGFAEGALAGFGAVNKFYGDREDRRLRQQQQDDMAQYRADTIGLQRDQLAETVRRNTLADERASRQLGIQEQNAATAGINAEAALLRQQIAQAEQTAKDKQRNEKGLTLEEQTAVDRNKALTDKTKQETKALQSANDRITGALTLNRIMELSAEGSFTPERKAEFDQLVKTSSEYDNNFNVARIISQEHQESLQTMGDLFNRVASGEVVDLNVDQRNAISSVLGFSNAKYKGQVVGKNFVNAPDRMKDGNHVIERTGLLNAQLVPGSENESDPRITGRMYIMTRNRKTGDIDFYFPSATEFRDPTSQTGLSVTVGQAMQVTSGTEYMRQGIVGNELLKDRLRSAVIQNVFGDEKSNGQEEFDKAVETEIELIREHLNSGATGQLNNLGYFRENEDPRVMAEEQIKTLTKRIEDRKLGIGAPSVRPVDEYLEESRQRLAEFPLPGTVISTNARTRNRSGIARPQTLGAVIKDLQDKDTADPNMIARLSTLFDPPENEGEPGRLRVSVQEFRSILKNEYGVTF